MGKLRRLRKTLFYFSFDYAFLKKKKEKKKKMRTKKYNHCCTKQLYF